MALGGALERIQFLMDYGTASKKRTMNKTTTPTQAPTITTSVYTHHNKDEDVPYSPARVEDLPPFVRFAMKHSPHKRPFLSVVMVFVGLLWFGVAVGQLTSSVVVGAMIYGIFVLFYLNALMLHPDSSKGEMLQQLLMNTNATKRGSNKSKTTFVISCIGCVLITIVLWIIAMVPFANGQQLGEHTFGITISITLTSSICFFCFPLLGFANTFVCGVTSLLWEHKLETYILQLHEILLQVVDNNIEAGNGQAARQTAVFNDISSIQKKAENWVRTSGRPLTSTKNTCSVTIFLISIAACLIVVAVETNVSVMIVFTLLAIFLLYFFQIILIAMANINTCWEKLQVQYFNDAKIQHSLILLNWSPERFKIFMNNHLINSQLCFGMKITVEQMRRIGGVVGSVFGIVLYFLLRGEMMALAGNP